MRLLFVGDIHGSWTQFLQYLKNCERFEYDAVVQVGDFGVYPGDMKMLYILKNKFGITKPIHFIDGNHEDHEYLFSNPKNLEKNGLFYHRRGTVTLFGSSVIGWFGGAFNVEKSQEVGPWGANYPTPSDVQVGIDTFNLYDIDVLVTHSCPSDIGVGMKGTSFFNETIKKFIVDHGYPASPLNDSGDYPLQQLWKGLIKKPKYNIFGHFHKIHEKLVGDTTFMCIGSNVNGFLPCIYDTETKEVLV